MFETWLLETLKFILPALVLLVGMVVLTKKLLDDNYRLKLLEHKNQTSNLITPVRLQAYERLVTYLERISFSNLIGQNYQQGQTVQQLHLTLLMAIREEFSYNIAQQIYVSNDVWQLVVTSKEELIKVLNSTVIQFNPTDDAQPFLEQLLTLNSTGETLPNEVAILFLKQELQKSF